MVAFTTRGPGGRYTLTVVNIRRAEYTFDPLNSVLSESIVVRGPMGLGSPAPAARPTSY